MNEQKVRVRKFIDKDGHCIVIGASLGCSKLTMQNGIIPEVRHDFPGLPDTAAYVVVLLKTGEEKGKETVVGLGLKFVPLACMVVPDSYVPLPTDYTQRGELPLGDETFSLWKSQDSGPTFYKGSIKGCSLAGLETLFRTQEAHFSDADPKQCSVIFFSRNELRGIVGLRLPRFASVGSLPYISTFDIPRHVP